MNNRVHTITRKCKTPFGSMYIHINYDQDFRPCGGSISHPGKEPESTISQLINDMSVALDHALNENVEDDQKL